MKQFFSIFGKVMVAALLGLGGILGYFWFSEGAQPRDVYNFIPEDFVFLIQSDKPLEDWRSLSKSKPWLTLKKAPYFAEMTKSANKLDSLITANPKIGSIAKLGTMLISAHITKSDDYDFVFLLDMNDNGKLSDVQVILPPIFKQAGYRVQTEKLYNYTLYKLYDPEDRTTLSLLFAENVLVGSYTEKLVKKAVEQSTRASILEEPGFKKMYEETWTKGMYSMMVNYKQMNAFLRIFSPNPSEMIQDLQASVSYSGMNFNTRENGLEFAGHTQQIENAASYLSVFREIGTGSIEMGKVLPKNTAMYNSIGFEDFDSFYTKLMEEYKRTQPEEYKDIEKNQQRIEKWLKIDLKEDFFSWIKEEVGAAIVPITDSTGETRYENIALLHYGSGNFNQVNAKLEHVQQQVKKRTPLKFEKQEYQGYEIRYLEMRDLFKVFFKKLFNKIEKPHYCFIGQYVIFANDVATLEYMIDQYESQQTLAMNSKYSNFTRHFDTRSNIFTYLNLPYFMPYMAKDMNADSRSEMDKNKILFTSFPQVGFQMSPEKGMFKTKLFTEVGK